MAGPFNALHRNKWGYAQFHGMARRVSLEGAGGATDGVGKQGSTWLIMLRRGCLLYTSDAADE